MEERETLQLRIHSLLVLKSRTFIDVKEKGHFVH